MSKRTAAPRKTRSGRNERVPSPSTPAAGAVGSEDQIQRTLDEALADSFPASDPVSIVTSQHEEAWQTDTNAGSRAGEPRKGGSRR